MLADFAAVTTILLPIAVLLAALALGPLPIVTRGLLRGLLGPAYVHRWYRCVSLGLSIGMILTAGLMAFIARDLVVFAVLICLLLLLAVIDWQWRWLPIEWTLAVIALGLLHGLSHNQLTDIALQILAPSFAVLAVRQVFLMLHGREALGLGDVWLIAGLGAFLPIAGSFFLIGFAAVSGLVELAVRRLLSGKQQKLAGVSYGTHLCGVFLFLQSFPQFN